MWRVMGFIEEVGWIGKGRCMVGEDMILVWSCDLYGNMGKISVDFWYSV